MLSTFSGESQSRFRFGFSLPTEQDRRRYFEIARGSALEWGAIQDSLEISGVLSKEENEIAKGMLIRIVSILTKLGKRDDCVQGARIPFGDHDNDHGMKSQQGESGDGYSAPVVPPFAP